MKLNYLQILLFLLGITSQSQMYVSPSTYMYVNDQVVYITGNVELNAATSNIYLRNQAQLLQGTAVIGGANLGLGALSVYQEGSVNNYQYNYWCSPVGGSLVAAGNSLFGITQLGVPTTATATTPATILAYPAKDGVSSLAGLSIAEHWIWKYTTSTTYAQWIYTAATTTIGAGQGFAMKGTSGSDATVPHAGTVSNNAGSKQRYDFRGKPNDGTINVPVINATQTLTGNPYPSALNMNAFLTDPANALLCDGTALYWEHDKSINSHLIAAYQGGYGIYNGTSSVYTPATFYTYNAAGVQGGVASTPLNVYKRNFAPIGQGFMIVGIAAGNVQIKNTHRAYVKEGIPTNSQFEKNSGPLNLNDSDATPQILLNASLNNQAVRQVALVFMPNAIEGYDKADSKSPDANGNLPYDMYLYLDKTEYVQSANKFDINNKYPVGFKNNTDASFRIQVASFVNFSGAQNVYLHDKTTDLYHDIKNAEYEVSLPTGLNNNRFEITFVNNTLTNTGNIADDFTVFQNNGNEFLTIKNPKAIALQSCTLYDVSGKTVLSKTNLGSNLSYEYNTVGLGEGVYIVKLITGTNQEITKKISIFSNK